MANKDTSAGPSGNNSLPEEPNPYNEAMLDRASASLRKDVESGSLRFLWTRGFMECEKGSGWDGPNLWEGPDNFMGHITRKFPLPPRANFDQDDTQDVPCVKSSEAEKTQGFGCIAKNENTASTSNETDETETSKAADIKGGDCVDKSSDPLVRKEASALNKKSKNARKRLKRKERKAEQEPPTKKKNIQEESVVVSDDSDLLVVLDSEESSSEALKYIVVSTSSSEEEVEPWHTEFMSRKSENPARVAKASHEIIDSDSSSSKEKATTVTSDTKSSLSSDTKTSSDLVFALSNSDGECEDGEIQEDTDPAINTNENKIDNGVSSDNSMGKSDNCHPHIMTNDLTHMEKQIKNIRRKLNHLDQYLGKKTNNCTASVCKSLSQICSKIERFSNSLDSKIRLLPDHSEHKGTQTENASRRRVLTESLERHLGMVWSQYEKIRVVRSDAITRYNQGCQDIACVVRSPVIKKWPRTKAIIS